MHRRIQYVFFDSSDPSEHVEYCLGGTSCSTSFAVDQSEYNEWEQLDSGQSHQ